MAYKIFYFLFFFGLALLGREGSNLNTSPPIPWQLGWYPRVKSKTLKQTHIMYFVAQMFKYSQPSIIFNTESYEDALAFTAIMQRRNPETEYKVLKEA